VAHGCEKTAAPRLRASIDHGGERTLSGHVLVTGGCGFIGANLVRLLVAEGFSVRVLDDLRNGKKEYLDGLDVDVVNGDIADTGLVSQLLAGAGAIVHLAASGSVVDSVADPTINFETNVVGTFRMLDAANRAGIDRFIFASTGGALIGDADPPVDERSLPKPISPYGASKLAAEAYCHAFARSYGMHTLALRFANVYGPFSGHKKGAVTAFFRALHDGTPMIVYGDGSASRDFMHVDDICRGIVLGLTSELPGGAVVHLATGVETSIAELADACRRAASMPKHPIEHRPQRPGEVGRNFATFDLARERLGFTPATTLEDGLTRTWEWYQRNVFD
jgi:UDP-glucose 4-epimerase